MRYILSLMLLMPLLCNGECNTVAIVFDTRICQEEISLSDPGTSKAIKSDTRHEIEMKRLAHRIRSIAAQQLLSKQSYTPTQDEVSRYMDFSARSKASQVRHTRELIAVIEDLLASHQYTERNRKRLQQALASYRRLEEQEKRIEEDDKLRDEDMRKRFGEDAVTNLYEKIKQSRHRISEQWVARWKMNKALYEKYGGRIIFQQAGIEPIDAYRAQLQDIRDKGKLKILKPDYKAVFADFERYLDMGHNYLSENGKKYFARPYWETADIEASHQEALKEYRAIPHINLGSE